MGRRRLLRPLVLTAAMAAAAAPVAGQGSSVSQQSACVSARGGAAVATPCLDASSIYYNPALLAMMPSAVSAGLTAVYNSGSFTYDTTGVVVDREAAMPLVPQAYASYRFGPDQRLAAGFGFWAPYGLGIEWPESFEGRFISWKTALRGIYLQPTLAYQIIPGKLAIGGGVDVTLGGIEINQHLDAPVINSQLAALGVPLGTDVAKAKLSGSGTGFGGHIGLYYQATDRLAFGARYMHKVKVDLDGDADFTPIWNPGNVLLIPQGGVTVPVPLDSLIAPQFATGGPLADQTATASLTFPPQAVVGFRFDATEALAVSFDYQWTGWSTFDQISAAFENGGTLDLVLNYKDTNTYRGGLTYAATPALELRGGFIYNTAASPDETVTPILPEAERQLYTAGFGYHAGKFQADVYYNYVNQADRRGRVRSEMPIHVNPLDLNVGVYKNTAHLFGVTLSYVFGSAR